MAGVLAQCRQARAIPAGALAHRVSEGFIYVLELGVCVCGDLHGKGVLPF